MYLGYPFSRTCTQTSYTNTLRVYLSVFKWLKVPQITLKSLQKVQKTLETFKLSATNSIKITKQCNNQFQEDVRYFEYKQDNRFVTLLAFLCVARIFLQTSVTCRCGTVMKMYSQNKYSKFLLRRHQPFHRLKIVIYPINPIWL